MKSKSNSPPRGLSREASQWWRRLSDEFSIEDEAGRLLLATALEAFDRMRGAQAIIRKDGLTITDRFGQPKPHPAAVIERDARSGLLSALRQLKLDPNVITTGA